MSDQERINALETALKANMEELQRAYRMLYNNDSYAQNASEAIRVGKEALSA